jgi:hypothetical protein
MRFSPASCRLIPLRSKYCPQRCSLNTFLSCSSPHMRVQVSNSFKTDENAICVLHSRREDEKFGVESWQAFSNIICSSLFHEWSLELLASVLNVFTLPHFSICIGYICATGLSHSLVTELTQSVFFILSFLVSSNKLITSAQTSSWCVLFSFSRSLLELSPKLHILQQRRKPNGDKASLCFKPFWIWNIAVEYLAYFPYFEEIKVGLRHHYAVHVSTNLHETWYVGLCHHYAVYVSTNLHETWYGTWFYLSGVLHKSLPSVCVCMRIPLSLLGNCSAESLPAMNTHETIKELLDVSFSRGSVSYQRSVG